MTNVEQKKVRFIRRSIGISISLLFLALFGIAVKYKMTWEDTLAEEPLIKSAFVAKQKHRSVIFTYEWEKGTLSGMVSTRSSSRSQIGTDCSLPRGQGATRQIEISQGKQGKDLGGVFG